MKKWFKKLKNNVKILLEKDYSGHDYWHAIRVCNISEKIGKKEKADLDILLAASLLHDIYAGKNYITHVERAVKFANKVLRKVKFPKNKIERVISCIRNHEKYEWGKTSKISKEAKILQDADRLDALGAIGIARTFIFSGYNKIPLWIVGQEPKKHYDYKKISSSINHFYEKLLKLKENMNTKTAKNIARERHKFMEIYLERFFKEWEGEL